MCLHAVSAGNVVVFRESASTTSAEMLVGAISAQVSVFRDGIVPA